MAEVEGGAIAGYVVYACEGKRLHLLNLAVAPEFRGRGIGKACIEKLKSKLGGPYRLRTAIFTEVREGNLPAQLFFRSMGFRACGIVSGWWQPYSDEGAYVFSFHAGSH